MQEIVETKKKSIYQEEEDIFMYCLDFAMCMCFFRNHINHNKRENEARGRIN